MNSGWFDNGKQEEWTTYNMNVNQYKGNQNERVSIRF